MEEEQSQQRELALEKDKMATAFDNLKNLVEEDADTEAEYIKVTLEVVNKGTYIEIVPSTNHSDVASQFAMYEGWLPPPVRFWLFYWW